MTVNVDILRQCVGDPALRAYLEVSSFNVPDGMPIVWASKLAGMPLPVRVTGSDLLWSIAEAIASAGGSIFLLGGKPGTAQLACNAMTERIANLQVDGSCSLPMDFDVFPSQVAEVCDEVVAARSQMVFVGLGFPKQERIIELLRPRMPNVWFLGCGAALDFAAGLAARTALDAPIRLGMASPDVPGTATPERKVSD